MALKIASWNVNSIRQRFDHLDRFIKTQAPDVLCMQEIKVTEDLFPYDFFADRGYGHVVVAGQKAYHGVAIASRLPVSASGTAQWCGKDDKRYAFVKLKGGLEVHNFYVPAGGDVPDRQKNDKFEHKLTFLEEMTTWAEEGKRKGRILVGDLNVAPLENDVWNHTKLVRNVGHSPQETDRFAALLKAGGLVDVGRHFVPADQPLYSWWGYRFPQAFAKNYGWRLDHALATAKALKEIKGFSLLRETRTWDKPSDHIPLILDLT